jgi:hypothetical protein
MLFEGLMKKEQGPFCKIAFTSKAASVFHADSPIAGLDSYEVNIPSCKISCRTAGQHCTYYFSK